MTKIRCMGCGREWIGSMPPHGPCAKNEPRRIGIVQASLWVCTCGRSYDADEHSKCPHCGRPCHSPAESTPPETPYAKQRRRPESLMPPRAAPGAAFSAMLITVASVTAGNEQLPVHTRAFMVVVLSLVAWLVGYFTPPPRRKFRRGDP